MPTSSSTKRLKNAYLAMPVVGLEVEKGNIFGPLLKGTEIEAADIDTQFLAIRLIDFLAERLAVGQGASRQKRGVPEIKPAAGLYKWLLDHGRPGPIGNRQAMVNKEKVEKWFLGDKLVLQKIWQLFDYDFRISQENIGLEELLHIDLDFYTLILYPTFGVQDSL